VCPKEVQEVWPGSGGSRGSRGSGSCLNCFLTAEKKKAFESDYWPPKTLVREMEWSKHKFYPDTMTHEK